MPTQNVSHVDEMLSNVAVAAFQDESNFIASRVFPDVPVQKQSDRYAVIPAGDFNRDEMQRRADASESSGSDFTMSTDNYFCDVWAHHFDYGEQARANGDSEFNIESNITRFLTNKALLRKEKLFAQNFFTTGVWDSTFTPTTKWDAASGATPVKDVRGAILRQSIITGGFRPNVLVTTQAVVDALLQSEDVINRVLYNATGGVADPTIENLRQLFEVDEILVMNGVENIAPREYVDDADGSGRRVPKEVNRLFVDTNSMLLLYRTSSPAGSFNPSAGYTFSWSGLEGVAGMGTRMLSYDIPLTPGAKRVEIEMAFDMKVQSSHFGTLMNNLFTTDPLDLATNGQDGEYTIYGA